MGRKRKTLASGTVKEVSVMGSDLYKNLNTNLMSENVKQERMGATMCQLDEKGSLPFQTHVNNNSWFVVGHYKTQGHIINLLFHIMGMKIPVLGWQYQSVVTVFDETTGYYFTKDHIYRTKQTVVRVDEFNVKVPNGSMSGTWDCMRIQINEGPIKADLEMKAIHYPILIGGNSIIDICKMCIHEYSIPRMVTKGKLSVADHDYELTDTGFSWFDRQWQNIDYRHSMMKWTWMAISLSNGDIISVFDTDYPGYEDNVMSLLSPDGTQTNIRPIPRFIEGEKEYWISSATKRKYPVLWKLKIPQLDAELKIIPVKKEQEIKSVLSELNKYEGNCTVIGSYKGQQVTGHALVEMIGPWKK